jgi:hypothetical protein
VVGEMLAEAARLGLTTVEVKAALDRELDGRGA